MVKAYTSPPRCAEYSDQLEQDMSKRQRRVTRREFGTTLAAAGVFAAAPAILRGRNLNDKLNIAFIACGGRALTSLSELTIAPGR